jgi:hypothetical protein
MEDYDRALELYEQIRRDYPDYARRNNIEKYITRSRISS